MSTIKTILATTILATTLTANAEFQYLVDLPPSFKASNVEYTLSEESPIISGAVVTSQNNINPSNYGLNVNIEPITTSSAKVEVTNKSNEIIHTQTIDSTATEIVNIASEGIEFIIDGSAGYNSSEDYSIGLVGSILDPVAPAYVEISFESDINNAGPANMNVSVSDHNLADALTYPITMTFDGAAMAFEARYGSNQTIIILESGHSLTFEGLSMTFTDIPSDGDSFSINRTN